MNGLNRGQQRRWNGRNGWAGMVTACAAATMVGVPAAVAQVACRYEITAILTGPFCQGWGNAPMFARGLSNHEPPWVTGFYTECTAGPDKAYVWTGSGPVQPLTFPGAGVTSSYAFDVTDTGLVIGAYQPSSKPVRGFIYNVAASTWIQLDPATADGGVVARAGNSAGTVVGSRNFGTGSEPYSAFIWQNGVYTDLGIMNGPYSDATDVSEYGTVVGWTGNSTADPNARAFVSQDGITTILAPVPGGLSSVARAVNTVGALIGSGRVPSSAGQPDTHAMYRSAIGKMTDLGVLAGYAHGFAYDISADGTVVGESRDLQFNRRACKWYEGDIVDLNSQISPNAQIFLYAAYGINDRGQILCEAAGQTAQVAVVLTPVFPPLGDITLDCRVNVNDLLLVINEWGKPKSPADINGDGIVNVLDLYIVIDNWTLN